jgi:serine/threonine protein kinase
MAQPSSALPVPPDRTGPWFLGRYELIGELARGGMGTVYLARHAGEAGFQRLFAIKALHPHLAEEKEFVDMLHDEARIAARIHHPNVVAVVDLGVQSGLHYVVMEYVEGPSFGTLLKRNRDAKCPPELVVAIVIDALEGLHAAHTLQDDEGAQQLLVHRDVSPQNILVGTDGVGRITDFGIAKAETRIASTRPGTRKGKLLFMSPEQITGNSAIDRRTDIWATGAVLWGALAGSPLFKGENDAATMHNVLNKEVSAPSKEAWAPPAIYDEIVLRALERDPAKRFESALEMADALRAATASSGAPYAIKQRIARWVVESFSTELEGRRKAIRDVATRRADRPVTEESSPVSWLAPLPSIASGASVSSDVSGMQSQPRDDASLQLDFHRSRMRSWMLVGLIAILAGIAGYFALGSRTNNPPSAAQAPGSTAASAAASATAPAAANEKPRAEQPTSAESATEAPREDLTAKPARAPTTWQRPVFTRPAKPETPGNEVTSQPPVETKSRPPASPMPTPAPQEDFEKNPYLRR